MPWEELPDNIKKAIQEDDKEALSRAGKKGAKVRQRNYEIKQEDRKEYEQKKAIEHEYNRILHESGEEAAEEYLKSFE